MKVIHIGVGGFGRRWAEVLAAQRLTNVLFPSSPCYG